MDKVPFDLWLLILKRLTPLVLVECSYICKLLLRYASDDRTWEHHKQRILDRCPKAAQMFESSRTQTIFCKYLMPPTIRMFAFLSENDSSMLRHLVECVFWCTFPKNTVESIALDRINTYYYHFTCTVTLLTGENHTFWHTKHATERICYEVDLLQIERYAHVPDNIPGSFMALVHQTNPP